MNAIQRLHDLGQSLWLDDIDAAMLDDGRLKTLIDDFSIAGLASSPKRLDQAGARSMRAHGDPCSGSTDEPADEARLQTQELADARAAADLFRPMFEASHGIDGWVSLAVSPRLANNSARTSAAVRALHARAERPNVLLNIPGTVAGMPAIEAAIFAGIPVQVTLLFSRAQYLAAAQAYMRAIERRLAVGLAPDVASVAALTVSPWDAALRAGLSPELRRDGVAASARRTFRDYRQAGVDPHIAAVTAMYSDWDHPLVKADIPSDLHDKVGIAVAVRCYRDYRKLLESRRWRRLAAAGARPQRLLWAGTASHESQVVDSLYVDALAAAGTINAVSEHTLRAFAEHGQLRTAIAHHSEDGEAVLARCARAGVDIDALAVTLQAAGVAAQVTAREALLQSQRQCADEGGAAAGRAPA